MNTTATTLQAGKFKLSEVVSLDHNETIYAILRKVSSSGMIRWFDFYVMRNNEPMRITWALCELLDYKYDEKQEALKIQGCGMDMGYAVVSALGYKMTDGEDYKGPQLRYL